jgi:hypothetical protein
MKRVKSFPVRQMSAVLVVLAATAAAQGGLAAPRIPNCDAPELVCLAAENQGASLYVRDRCRYEQRLAMERYEYEKNTQRRGELIAKRQTTVLVEPDNKPDETGQIPVLTKVVADTDDKGQPKEKVDPKARTGLASGAFLDQIFFPLLPEDIPFLSFEEVQSETEGERWFKFTPKPDRLPVDQPLAFGIARLDAKTGEVLTIEVTGLANLKAVDDRLEKITAFGAKIDYSQFAGKYRMPTAASGSGVSDISRFKGYFKFTFEEGKYAAVMKVE